MLETALVALLVLAFMCYRQFIARAVTRSDLMIPLIGAAYLAVVHFSQPTSGLDTLLIVGGALFGAASGLVSAQFVRVWRDAATGLVMQRGGWKYLLALLGLVAVRLVLRLATQMLRLDVDAAVLNDALIAMAVGNYAGRALLVTVRALALLGGDISDLPARRDLRATR